MIHTVYIALGSNIGNRAGHLHDALDAMAPFVALAETSHLYETIPMLVTEQPLFLNAVCKGTTALSPQELLAALKRVEDSLGRMKTIRYGPRSIDLDILFYDDARVDTPELSIPHPRIPERDFVLAPLLDLSPTLRHPRLGQTVQELWQQLQKPRPPRVLPLGERLWHWGSRTFVMGILNMTPDSFSGDGLANASDPVAAALAQAQQMAVAGADVLDIGGHSTRPGHENVPVAEEIHRVETVIAALHEAVDLPLSIDTFRAEVAEAALAAGASWLNDVWGLRLSSAMGELAARARVPLVLMHNRTTPPAEFAATDPLPALQRAYNYADVAQDVCRELAESVELARAAGVPRWHRIVDPGIGFGKTTPQHAALIARLDELQTLEYPLLFGASRKGFLGKLAGGLPVQERLAATVAANVLAAERGAQIVRVHDVRPNVQALRVTDAVMRARATAPAQGGE